MSLFTLRFTAITENSKAIWHFSRLKTHGHFKNQRRVTSDARLSGSVNAEVESSLGPGWWAQVGSLVCPLCSITSKPPGSSLAPLGRRAWPPDPAELPSGCAVLFCSSFSAALRGVAATAAVAGCVYFCLRSLPVDLLVADQQQPVQQVVVGTSDKETAGSFLPDLQARTETERNIFQAHLIFFSPQFINFLGFWDWTVKMKTQMPFFLFFELCRRTNISLLFETQFILTWSF